VTSNLEHPATQSKLKALRGALGHREARVAIVGLGSVGHYLLTYLLSSPFPLKIYLLGRSRERMTADLNIAKVAADIRRHRHVVCELVEVDLADVAGIGEALARIEPDFLVNASRAYAHIKYGSISWHTVRAYGIWAPLSVRYAKNIMTALQGQSHQPLVINTSYSDAVNAWIRSAGLPFPDFGSGNLNHLLPRIRFAVAEAHAVADPAELDITLATSHFHDVVISKEGHCEGQPPLLAVRHRGERLSLDEAAVYKACAIPMPVDAKRNMMNASSNYEIIANILEALGERTVRRLHVPGALGMVGGYPMLVDGSGEEPALRVDTGCFPLQDMLDVNARSIYLDGIAGVADGRLAYTDELIEKTERAFGYRLPKHVHLQESDEVVQALITQVIEKRP